DPRGHRLRRGVEDLPALEGGELRHRFGAALGGLERALDVGRVRARHGVDQALVVRVTHLDLLGLVEPLTCDVHLHDCVLQQGAGTRASPRPHPAASSRSLTRSRSTCVRTPSVATPAPRRQLTLAHALPLHLPANTQRRHARTPPPSHARSRPPAPPTRESRAPPRAHPPRFDRYMARPLST